MTPEDLKEAKEACRNATPGKWRKQRTRRRGSTLFWDVHIVPEDPALSVCVMSTCQPDPEATADAIIAARTALPEALEFIVELLWEQFYAAAHLLDEGENAGWYDSCCNKNANWTASYLIPLGFMKEKSGSVDRRRFYRPIEKEKHDT